MVTICLTSRIVLTLQIFTTIFLSLNRLFTRIFTAGEAVADASPGISFSTVQRSEETCLTPPIVEPWSDSTA